MDEMHAFERQVAGQIQRFVGPVLPVDDLAVLRAVSAATRSRDMRLRIVPSATSLAAAGVMLAVLGGFLIVAQPFDREGPMAPGAASTMSPQPSEAECGPSEPEDGRELIPGCGYSVGLGGFEVPTWGWAWTDEGAVAKGGAEIAFLSLQTPDGTYADPCGLVRGEPIHVGADGGDAILRHSADLMAAMAAIPGIEVVDGPSEVIEPDGFSDTRGHVPANHVVIRVPEDACTPFGLWWDSDLRPRQVTRSGDTIRIWVYNHPFIRRFDVPLRIWIEAETPADADPALDREIQLIIDSIDTPS